MARHGENIRKRKDGRWEGRYKAFDRAKGQYVYRSVYGRSYGEAKERLSRFRFGLTGRGTEEEMAGNGGAVLFSQVAEEWLAEICSRRKYSTYIKYGTVYRTHLAETIGSCQFCADAAQELREKISDHISGEGMSESLKKSIVCIINQIVSFANDRYSSGIPPLELTPAKMKRKSAGIFSKAEQTKLLDYIREGREKFTVAVLLCLYAGLRLGELCALRWVDIDFESMTLTVDRTVQRMAMPGHRLKTALLETDPKSGSSRRTIPMPPELLGALSGLKAGQPYVFGGDRSLDPRTMQYRFQKILKAAGVDGRNFHTLRHTFATNCIENGMDVKSLSEILGHSDVRITLNRYVHPTMDLKRKQMGALADFYGQICGQAV